jgi:calcineurin-like phosphoesterase family protein
MWFFTSDEHYNHSHIIKYCNRPFSSVEEMNEELIKRFNSKVKPQDVTIHAGDFSWKDEKTFIECLNGTHIFLVGSHDHWLPDSAKHLYSGMFDLGKDCQYIVVGHYAMRVWPRSHYNSWNLFGHSHGRLEPIGKQWDIGVDNNNFYPLSLDEITTIMKDRPDNFNLVVK